MTDDTRELPRLLLEPIEARVLGCLVEKAATTPEVYPLTLNAVVAACNQKSNRDPLLDLEPGAVGHALRQLEGKRLVAGSMWRAPRATNIAWTRPCRSRRASARCWPC